MVCKLSCKYCIVEGEVCTAETTLDNGRKMFCTRPAGHAGVHAACGKNMNEHPIHVWAQLRLWKGDDKSG